MGVRVAVTGGSGFIGTAVRTELRRKEYDVVNIDNTNGADVLGSDFSRQVAECNSVIHLAGLLGTEELFADAENAIDVNIKGTVRVLEACRANNASFIGIAVPDVWANVYQATKQASRRLASAWHQNFDVPVAHVRAFNAFGPGQKHYGVQKIIPTFSVRAWAGLPIPIWGTGEQTVDLVYVDDIANMLVDVMRFGDDQVFDGGTGHPLTVNEVANIVLEVTGSRAGVEYYPMRKGETPTDIVAAGEGWDNLDRHPVFREDDLARTVRWYQEVR